MSLLTLTTPTLPALRLRQAHTAADAELLRVWKNMHRQHFFYKEEISPAQQAAWFAKHLAHKWDVMLMVEEQVGSEPFTPVGCMGYRLQPDQSLDLYNILRGQRLVGGQATMGQAFTLMLNGLVQTYRLPLKCSVLANNPARAWYEALGMEAVAEHPHPEPHVVYVLNPLRLTSQTVCLTLT